MFGIFSKKPVVVNYDEKTILLDRLKTVTNNAVERLKGALGVSHDGNRNQNEVFGYPENPSFEDFYSMYLDGGMMRNVVDKVAKGCWRDVPAITSPNGVTDDEFLNSLKKCRIFEALERADILNRIGRYSVLYIAIPDGKQPHEPLGKALGIATVNDLSFTVFQEPDIRIKQTNDNPGDKRRGMPEIYTLTAGGFDSDLGGCQQQQVDVHHSRIVHLAEGALQNPLIGESALRAPYRAALDMMKARGAGAEAFYRNASPATIFSTKEGAETDSTPQDEFTAAYGKFASGFNKALRTANMDVNQIKVNTDSPKDLIECCHLDIFAASGIPERVLTTKSGGQTTGTEDKGTWNALLLDRKESFCDLVLKAALFIIDFSGVIQLPEDYDLEWSPSSALTEKEQVEVNQIKAETLEKALEIIITLGDACEPQEILQEHGINTNIDLKKLIANKKAQEEKTPNDKGGENENDI